MDVLELTQLIDSSIRKLEKTGHFKKEVVFLHSLKEKYPDKIEKQDVKNILLIILNIGYKADIENLFILYIYLKDISHDQNS